MTTSGLPALVAVTDASEAAAEKCQPPQAWPPEAELPTAARQPPPQLPPAALSAPPPSLPPCLHRYCHGPRATEAERAEAAPPPVTAATAAALLSRDKTGTHSGRTNSHVDALAPDHAATVLHRRLHVGLDRTKKLVANTADTPASLAKAGHASCDDCVTAQRQAPLAPKGKLYKPSH